MLLACNILQQHFKKNVLDTFLCSFVSTLVSTFFFLLCIPFFYVLNIFTCNFNNAVTSVLLQACNNTGL